MIRGVRWVKGDAAPRFAFAAVQGNVLRPYGFPVCAHLFAQVSSARDGRAALTELLPLVTSGAVWTAKPESTLNISFTYAGLEALGVPQSLLGSFPDTFRAGHGGASRDPRRHRAL